MDYEKYIRILKEEEEEEDPLEDFALLVDAGRHSSDYVLYKPKYYAQQMKKAVIDAKEEFDSIRFKGRFDSFKDFYAFSNVQEIFKDPQGIYGFVSVNNGRVMGIVGTCNRANEIRAVSAKPGYGRLMFLIALARESPIMPSREESKEKTYEYWRDLAQDQGIEKEKFSNERGLHKKSSSDCFVFGDPILDQSYNTKEDVGYQLQPLLTRHKVFLNQMKNFFHKSGVDYIQSRVKEYLADAGSLFHSEKRGEESWYESEEAEDDLRT